MTETTPAIDVVDFHAHYRPPWWDESGLGARREPNERLDDPARLVRDTTQDGIVLRALSAPVELLFGPDHAAPTTSINRVNEYLRQTIDGDERFVGLATVNAYAGDEGGEQARYAIEELGLNGLVLDSGRNGLYAGAPEVRPALEVAARNNVPVFVHPVFSPGSDALERAAGRGGVSFGRGFVNGTSLLSVLHSGVLQEFPGLHIVFTALSTGSLLFAAEQIAPHRDDAAPLNLYLDTMRFHPPTLRYLVEVLGADRVLVGTDWPIRTDDTGPAIREALAASGFTPAQQQSIASGNARRLFAATRPVAV